MSLTPDLQPWERLGNLAAAMRRLEGWKTTPWRPCRAAGEAYQRLVRSSDYEYGRLWADAWCAAFVWPKQPDCLTPLLPGRLSLPHHRRDFREIERNPHYAPKWMRDEIQRLAGRYQFFHWHLAFPHIFTANAARPVGHEASHDKRP
jgi:hypothetical protein